MMEWPAVSGLLYLNCRFTFYQSWSCSDHLFVHKNNVMSQKVSRHYDIIVMYDSRFDVRGALVTWHLKTASSAAPL